MTRPQRAIFQEVDAPAPAFRKKRYTKPTLSCLGDLPESDPRRIAFDDADR